MRGTLNFETAHFLKSLGYPELNVHHPYNHYDFTRPGRRILVIGPMGSGKTEYSARVWRDSQVVLKKSDILSKQTTTKGADRRHVIFVRSALDEKRFENLPRNVLAYRGGFEKIGENLVTIKNSFELEEAVKKHPEAGTWIIDETSFFEERLVYVLKKESEERGVNFIFPALILNFRKDIFNSTARLLLECATDIFPLSAYCEDNDCLKDAFYTYRYYTVDDTECPALYFDPLIIIGGDREKKDSREPDYCTRCDNHHYLPAKEYTYLVLKPLGEAAARGETDNLEKELYSIKNNISESLLYKDLKSRNKSGDSISMNSLKVPLIAEKAIIFLFAEQNLLSGDHIYKLTNLLSLDRNYLEERLSDNGKPVNLSNLRFKF